MFTNVHTDNYIFLFLLHTCTVSVFFNILDKKFKLCFISKLLFLCDKQPFSQFYSFLLPPLAYFLKHGTSRYVFYFFLILKGMNTGVKRKWERKKQQPKDANKISITRRHIRNFADHRQLEL